MNRPRPEEWFGDRLTTADFVLLALGAGLTGLAAARYLTGEFGAAIVSGIGALLTFAFVVVDEWT